MEGSRSHDHQNLHFVLIPWLAQGHMIPMTDIARLLAGRGGTTVSVITTPANAARIQPTIDRISSSGLPIRFVSLRFPSVEFGLPEGCENQDSLESSALVANFFNAVKHLREPLVRHLREHAPAPSCIIADYGHPWTHEVALEFGVPRLVFHGFNCFSLLCIQNLEQSKSHEAVSSDSDSIPLPGLPHRIEITRPQLPLQFHRASQYHGIFKETREGELAADGVVVNSFDELEPGYIERLREATGKKAWMVGPVSLCKKAALDVAQRGNMASIDESRCMRWLDSKEPKSVIYVSFGSMGSMGSLSPAQLVELGSGLLASNQPFIWVINRMSSPEVEKWISEQFEERADSKCLLIRGWAPQVTILSHPAVGGFLTHCGWNSALESVCAGVPMVTWPMFAEQFLNEKLVVEVLGIGVSLGVKRWTVWGGGLGEEGGGVVVSREEVAEAVGRLMEEGEERRRRAEELGEKATRALEDGGSSDLSITNLIQYVSNQVEFKRDRCMFVEASD